MVICILICYPHRDVNLLLLYFIVRVICMYVHFISIAPKYNICDHFYTFTSMLQHILGVYKRTVYMYNTVSFSVFAHYFVHKLFTVLIIRRIVFLIELPKLYWRMKWYVYAMNIYLSVNSFTTAKLYIFLFLHTIV